MKDFTGKVVWITGASSGIGEALAVAFAQAGARLILSARRVTELQRVKQNLALPEKDVLVLPLDLEITETFTDLVNQALDFFGQIHLVVHNGGISQRALVVETPLAIDQKLMAVNYFGAVALTKAILPFFIQEKTGHFVVISSVVGKFGTPLRSAYAASKHALHGFFDSLRAEITHHNLKVTLVCPGYIKTNISVNALTAQGKKHYKMDKNQEKGLAPEKCAAIILKAIIRGKKEILVGGKETLGVYIKRFTPGLFARVIQNMMPTKRG